MEFFKALPVRLLVLLLLLQAMVYYAVAARQEIIPDLAPLGQFPATAGKWQMEEDFPLEPEVQEVLRADDTLNRRYSTPDRDDVYLFLAFFKTQRYGQAPHSPKNCLPGSGWQPVQDGRLSVSLPDGLPPIEVNKYVISRGEQHNLVLYWYQSHARVIASEYAAKFWLVADAIRYRRSDTALVRVIVPVRNGVASAEATAVEFVRAAYPDIRQRLPQ